MRQYEIIILEDGKLSRTLKGNSVICVVDSENEAGEIESVTSVGCFKDAANLATCIGAAVHGLAQQKLSRKDEAEQFIEMVHKAINLWSLFK